MVLPSLASLNSCNVVLFWDRIPNSKIQTHIHYRKTMYFRRPPLVPTVPRVPSEISLFPAAHGQPSEIRLFPTASQPPVGNKPISDGWPTGPSEISGRPLTAVPRAAPRPRTQPTHTRTHTRVLTTPRRRRQDLRRPPARSAADAPTHRAPPPRSQRAAAPRPARRRPDASAPPPRRPRSQSAAAPTPALTERRRPDARSQRAAAPTAAHLPRPRTARRRRRASSRPRPALPTAAARGSPEPSPSG
jgi:hypothetical protein